MKKRVGDLYKIYCLFLAKDPVVVRKIVLSFLLMLFQLLLFWLLPKLLKHVSKEFISQDFTTASWILAATFGLVCLEKCIVYSKNIVFFPVVNNFVKFTTCKIIKELNKLDRNTLANYSIAEILSSLKRVSGSTRAILQKTLLEFTPLVMQFMIISYYLFSPLESLYLGFYLVVNFFIFRRIFADSIDIRTKAWSCSDKNSGTLVNSLQDTDICRLNVNHMKHIDGIYLQEQKIWQDDNKRKSLAKLYHDLLLLFFVAGYIACKLVQSPSLELLDIVSIKINLAIFIRVANNLFASTRLLLLSLADISKFIDIYNLALNSVNPKVFLKPSSPNVLVKLQNISIDYGHKLILQDLSLALKPRDRILIKGSNGSGKTSLLKIISGLQQPTSGLVKYNINQRSIVYISDHITIYKGTLFFNIFYTNDQSVEISSEISSILSYLNVSLGDQVCTNSLSSGEKVLIAIARAIAIDPKIVLFDECLNMLSLDIASKVLQIISHRCIMVVTNSEMLDSLFDRLVVIKEPKLLIKEA